MSKECIRNCPVVLEAIENYPEGAHPSVAMAEVLQACENAFDCPGPIPTEIETRTGIIRQRIETRPGFICGLAE